jgi:hypothetical protein
MQDSEKNRAALEHLVAPSPYTERPIGLSGLSAGAKVTVFGELQTNGTIVAVKVIALPSAQ